MKDLTVLITAAGNVFMPGTIACLKNNGERSIRVIGADMSDDSTILQMCDAAYQVPRGSDPAYVDVLLEICRRAPFSSVLIINGFISFYPFTEPLITPPITIFCIAR